MGTFSEIYEGYENTLRGLEEQCSQAEKNAIVAETTLKSLQEQRTNLVKECEAFAGMSMDEIPEALEKKKVELEEIMSKLGGIDISGEISEETLANIESIVKEYNIASQEE